MANWDFQRVQDIMRRVIARRNETDSLSDANELQSYIGEMIRDIMPQEVKNFENFDVYDFTTVSGQYSYTFNQSDTSALEGGAGQDLTSALGDGQDETQSNEFENIGPVAFSDNQLMRWYQDPVIFYDTWGFIDDVDSEQTAQPIDILFHNNRFEVRPIPDGAYKIRIPGFRRNNDFTNASSSDLIPENYWGRYIAYAAALDYMYDFGYDPERIKVVESRYRHYKGLVLNRSHNQAKNETARQRW